ncbi:MAG: MFS transporter [Myxococcales bacterium]|nr:MFS transporter [Myxococcales bacterium]
MSQAKLLRDRRLWPLFWTQFLGAANDNFFKNALVIMVAYRGMSAFGLDPNQLVIAASGIFILPFFLFSAMAGQLADKFSKTTLVRWTKAAEIGIMTLAFAGFSADNAEMLLVVLFFMGLQSSFFGPVKYAILPQLLREDELVGGNALVESGTFLAILLGTIAGGILIGQDGGASVVAIAVVVLAVFGLAVSYFVPKLPAQAPDLRFSWNPVTPALETFRITRKNESVFHSVLGISWFWFFGASILTVLPAYTKDVVHGDEGVVTLFLASFCVGIAAGSLLCEKFSRHRLELGLVPLGTIGMTLFATDLFLVGAPGQPFRDPETMLSAGAFLSHGWGVRILVDFTLIAISSGFFTVPLYTLIQQRSDADQRSRVVAGNNILNALFMVVASLFLMALFKGGLSIPQVFLILAILNAAVAFYIYKLIPEFLFRFTAWIIATVMYRIRIVRPENLPLEGPCVVVANHVSFVDWLLLASAVKTPARFVMYHGFFKIPLLGFLFRDAKVIPIAPAKEDVDTMEQAFDRIAEELEAGEIVCLFPEGGITRTGELERFRPGIERIIARTPVPVIPIAIKGMWGSFFSRKDNAAMRKPFRRFWSRVELVVGEPVTPENVTADGLGKRVAELGHFRAPTEGRPT